MEKKKKNRGPSYNSLALVLIVVMAMAVMSRASACPSGGTECRGCIVERIKYGCPSCKPILRCMARCLWGGSSESQCTQRCNCDNKSMKKKLDSCKKCMFKCKCSCAAA